MRASNAGISIALATIVLSSGVAACARGKQPDEKTVLTQSLHGYISNTAPQDEVSGCIDEALSTAIEHSIEARKRHEQVKRYNKLIHRVAKAGAATVNYMLCDRGFLPSIEGGQLMLDENIKVHDKASAELYKQMWLDQAHDKIVADVVDIVTGLGTSDQTRRTEIVTGAMDSLKSFVGDDTAKHIYDRLNAWSEKEQIQQADHSFDKDTVWTITERQTKVGSIIGAITKDDPVVQQVTKRVHKYSKHSKLATRTSQVVETACNIVSLSPTFVGPAAQAALLVFFTATGGPEEDKLLSEMYLGKRMQSRKDSLNNQAAMAINSYQLALQTHNVALMSCSHALVKRLGGSALVASVFPNAAVVGIATPGPEAAAHSAAAAGQPAAAAAQPTQMAVQAPEVDAHKN